MKNNKRKRVIATIAVMILFIIAILIVDCDPLLKREESHMQQTMKMAIQEGENTQELRDMLANYVERNADNTTNEGCFVKGYLHFLNADYVKAKQQFTQIKDTLKSSDSSFIKIYTYVFLNLLADKDSSKDEFLQNCKNILFYMKQDKDSKNDTFLQWHVAYYLVNDAARGANLLVDYLNTTKGLTAETKVKVAGNIGQMFSLEKRYSEALFYYFGALYLMERTLEIPSREYYQMKLLTCIGDINCSMDEYQNAIDYYNCAIEVSQSEQDQDREKEVINRSITLINACHAYLGLQKYDEVDMLLEQLDRLLPEIPAYGKDDVEILKNDLLAEKCIGENELEQAEAYLIKADELIQNDTYELMWNKDIYVEFSYAKLYKKRMQYDEAILHFNNVLEKSNEIGFGLEKLSYKELSEIYKEKNDLTLYSNYHQLYVNEIVEANKILTSNHVSFIHDLYYYYHLENVQLTYQIVLVLGAGVIALLVVLSLFFVWTIRRWRKMSFTDHMTGLNNRKYLNDYLNAKRKKIEGKVVSILIIDIDHFKKYNDFYGHVKGDMAIKEVADTVKACAKNSSIVIRYGGEEMAVLIFDALPDEEVIMAKQIQESVEHKAIEHKCSDISDNLTVSIGVYRAKYVGQNIYTLIDKADIALYRAKNNGRNRYEVYEDAESEDCLCKEKAALPE